MRKVIVWGFVLVAVGLLFTGAQAQRIAPIQDAPLRTPQQVEVVGGTVNVGNLPAVQNVGGMVSVGNLPVDGDGNLRVTMTPGGPAFRWFKVAENVPLAIGSPAQIGPVAVGGWRRSHAFARVTITSGNPTGLDGFTQCGGEGMLIDCGTVGTTSFDPSHGTTQTFQIGGGAEIVGPDLAYRFTMNSSDQAASAVVNEIWLYLSN